MARDSAMLIWPALRVGFVASNLSRTSCHVKAFCASTPWAEQPTTQSVTPRGGTRRCILSLVWTVCVQDPHRLPSRHCALGLAVPLLYCFPVNQREGGARPRAALN